MNRPETILLLAEMHAVWPQVDIKEGMSAVWSDLLADIDYDDARNAVRQLATTRATWPSIAAIRQLAEPWNEDMPPALMTAWADVLGQFRATGRHNEPTFRHHFTHEVIDAIGWRRLCEMNADQAERMFTDTYEPRAKRRRAALLGQDHHALPTRHQLTTGSTS
jgi:hypothetical protein